MSDHMIIAEAINTHDSGEVISDLQARVLASEWHDGQDSRLYALTSTGAIDNTDGRLGAELDAMQREASRQGLRVEWEMLREYVKAKGTRGPQDGWGALSW